MKYFQLNNGQSIPALGLGTWKAPPEQVKAAVKEAIRCGYRHVDCAFIYGNEADIGQALKECFQEGLCKREDLFVTSKLWNDSKHASQVIPALRDSLDKLQLDYLDMYLIHWPVAIKKGKAVVDLTADDILTEKEVPISATWKELEKAVKMGLTKGIGVSNFSSKKIDALLETAEIPPVINQVERHPYLQVPDLMAYCREKGIHVTAFSPLGSMDRPSFLKADDEPKLLEDKVIADIAKKHGVTPAQVLLHWQIQSGASTVAKSTNPKRIKENLDAVQITLDEQDMQTIRNLDRHRRYVTGSFWCLEGSPYTLETLWDDESA